MALWFLRGMRKGVVTTRYPRTPPDPWTRTLSTPPAFRPNALVDAVVDDLLDACPTGALRRDGDVLVYDLGACTACGRCLDAAPGAVEPSGEIELAATDRRDLVKRIPIRGGV